MGELLKQSSVPLVDTKLVYAHSLAALVALLISVIFGIVISLQLFLPELTGDSLPLGWGRLRYAHTQGIMLGWLGNAFIAFLYHAVPVLSGRPVTSQRLGRWLFGIWNFVILAPGWVLVLSGISQPIEWAEFPLVIDAVVLFGLVLAAIQFVLPFIRRGLEELYVSSWYIIGGLVFTCLAYPMGNLVPELVPGAASAAYGGLWIHDAVGLFVTPLALAIIYYVIPVATGRPIYSHFLSMIGFWGLFFLYPLNGTHHYVYSVIPMAAQMGAILASALLGVVVTIVVTNLLLSLKGSGFFPKDIALRYVSMAVIFYLIVSIQGSLQAQMSINEATHFTDWVIGHSHLAMLGFATFAAIGGIVHAWQRIPWAPYNPKVLNWSFWLLFVGISIMVTDLTIAGVVEGRLWQSGVPWLESLQAAKPYWIVRSLAAIPVAAGFICLFIGLCTRPEVSRQSAQVLAGESQVDPIIHHDLAPLSATAINTKVENSGLLIRMSYRVAALAGIVFFVGSVALLGFWPQQELNLQISLMSPANLIQPTASEERGRAIYAREGCAYCHTQQVRFVQADIQRFGAPTLAWETQFDYPHLWGTRRIGPDLAREGSVRSSDWQYAHLFSPRAVVPLSIMPSYAALFNGAADKPRQEAQDLLAYLETLGRARELAWPEGDAQARAVTLDDKWAQMSLNAPVLNAHSARTQPRGTAPALPVPASADIGQQLWQQNCVGCHGQTGLGDGPAANWLSPKPRNLAEHEYSLVRLADILWHGVAGTAMPAWRDQSPENLAALAGVVQSFSSPTADPFINAEMLTLGQQVYETHCTQCHGENGDGNGFAAQELPIAPTDFRFQRPSLGESLRVLINGLDGTSMAPWTERLNEEEMLAVGQYLRQFYQAGPDGQASEETLP